MEKCVVCGNLYENYLEIRQNGKSHIFDSFECAIHKLAPICKKCGCKIIGHGIQADEDYYCCAHCARKDGLDAKDNFDEQ